MAVNRDKVKKQMAENKQRSGKFRYLPKDSTTALRIVEFKDEDGEIIFARQLVEHREAGSVGGKALGICRLETFGKPCAFCKRNQLSKETGGEWEYDSKRRFAVNAIDINDKAISMRPWVLPVTAYDQIADFVMEEEYADVLEQKPGLPFNIKREGSGLETSYTVMPQRKPWPVSDELMKQVTDPLDQFGDPGLKEQCKSLGYEISDLFDDSELEEIGSTEKKKGKSSTKAGEKAETKASAKKSKTSSKKAEEKADIDVDADNGEIEVGCAVLYEDEDVVYHVNSIDGDDVEIEDDDGNCYEATLDQLSLVEGDGGEEEPEEPEESFEIEVGSEVTYRDEDAICVVKSIDGDDVVIEDADKEQFDVLMEDLTLSGPSF